MKKIFVTLFIFLFSYWFPAYAEPKMKLGLEVYNDKAMCGSCHTLKSTGSTGTIGPNLDELKPSMPQVIMTVTNGIGVMPAFDGILSSEEIEAVGYFVSTTAGQ